MRSRTQFLWVGVCALLGFEVATRFGGSALGDRAVSAGEKSATVGAGVASAGEGTRAGGEETARRARGTQEPLWKEAPETFLKLKALIEKQGSGKDSGRLAVIDAIGRMSAGELARLLEVEAENPDFFRRIAFDFQFAARRLAEMAPERAADLWLSKASLRMQAEDLLGPWARRDPQAFAAWCLKLSPEAQKATSSALGGIARENPEQFLTIAARLETSAAAVGAVRSAMEGFLEASKNKMDFASARDFAVRLPEGAMRTAALAQLARWPGGEFATHPEVVNAIAALPREDARRLGREMAQHAESLPPSYAREAAFMSALREQADREMPAAVKRLETLAGTADQPAAVRGFVEETARKDPSAALQWALTIPPAEPGSSAQVHRSAALEKAAAEWFKQNPEAARQWVETAPLSDSEYFQLTGRTRGK